MKKTLSEIRVGLFTLVFALGLPACVLLNHPSLFLGKGAGKLVKKFGLPISFRLLEDDLVMMRYLVDRGAIVYGTHKQQYRPFGSTYDGARPVVPSKIEEWWVENCTGGSDKLEHFVKEQAAYSLTSIFDSLSFEFHDCVRWLDPASQPVQESGTSAGEIPRKNPGYYQILTFMSDASGRVRFWHVRDPVEGELYRPHGWVGWRLLKRVHDFEDQIRDNPVEIEDDPEKVYRDLPTEMLEFFKPPPEVSPLKEEKTDQ